MMVFNAGNVLKAPIFGEYELQKSSIDFSNSTSIEGVLQLFSNTS